MVAILSTFLFPYNQEL